MTTRTATCACGQLSIRCEGDPLLVSLCNCLDCQKRTGGVFGLAAFFDRANVTPSGEAKSYARSSDSGWKVTFHFCPTCGGSVYWEPERKPELVAIGVGGFADPTFPAPTQSVHNKSRHPWISFPTAKPRD